MASLRTLIGCIGARNTGTVSVLADFFGFSRGQVPANADGDDVVVSLRQQMDDVQGDYVNVNIIGVGFDQLSAAAQEQAREKIDYSISQTRKSYRGVNVGVGRIRHFRIDAATAAGADDIGTAAEADALSDRFTGPAGAIDAFVVRNISAPFVGISPVPGDCVRNSTRDGLLAGEINRSFDGVARTFAHEIGHFLGLPHNHGDPCPRSIAGRNNLMAQTRCALSTRNSILLTNAQGGTMRNHCSIRNDC